MIGWIPQWKRGGTPARVLVLNGAALAFPILGVPFNLWHVIPVIAAWFCGFSYLVPELCRRLAKYSITELARGRAANRIEAAISVVVVAAVALRVVPIISGCQEAGHLDAYREAALWIRDYAPPDSTVAYYEVGVIGWYSERPIQDLLGLVTPAMIQDLAHGRSFGSALRERPTALVLDHTDRRICNLPSRKYFRKIYEPVAVFPDAGGGELVVFRKRPSVPGQTWQVCHVSH